MQKVTVTSVAVAATKFQFGMSHCIVNSDVSTGDFSLVLEISRSCWRFRTCSDTPRAIACVAGHGLPSEKNQRIEMNYIK